MLARIIMIDKHQISSFYFHEFFVYLQIERLCDHLQSATCIEDRRDAMHALKALSKVSKKKVFHFSNIFVSEKLIEMQF